MGILNVNDFGTGPSHFDILTVRDECFCHSIPEQHTNRTEAHFAQHRLYGAPEREPQQNFLQPEQHKQCRYYNYIPQYQTTRYQYLFKAEKIILKSYCGAAVRHREVGILRGLLRYKCCEGTLLTAGLLVLKTERVMLQKPKPSNVWECGKNLPWSLSGCAVGKHWFQKPPGANLG